MSRRSEQLKKITRDFLAVHDEWKVDDNRPNPDETYWDAVTTLLDAVEHGDIPGDVRPLVTAAEAFADEVDKFDGRDNDGDLYPHDAFWLAIDGMRKVLEGPTRRELPPLETIKSLAGLPYMQHAQIAEIYGFRDRQGRLMPSLVQKELDAPGSVLNTPGSVDGRDWKDPRVTELDEQDTAADRAEEAIERKGRRSRKESSPCTETPRELWEQGVGPVQAAQMLKQDHADVAKQFAEWTASSEFNRKVWAMLDDGAAVDKIAKKLKSTEEKVTVAIRERPMVGAPAGEGD